MHYKPFEDLVHLRTLKVLGYFEEGFDEDDPPHDMVLDLTRLKHLQKLSWFCGTFCSITELPLCKDSLARIWPAWYSDLAGHLARRSKNPRDYANTPALLLAPTQQVMFVSESP